jgi:hypothetical protein
MADIKPFILSTNESHDSGPAGWYREKISGTYADLQVADQPDSGLKSVDGDRMEMSGPDGETTGDIVRLPAKNIWQDVLGQYHRRRTVTMQTSAEGSGTKGAAVEGGKNWRSLGPQVMLRGQALGDPAMGGRIAGLVVAPGGQVLYAASANGGVFLSENAGALWRPLMDGFDLDPTNIASTSLCCGAIALHPSNIHQIYVGTGEGAVYDYAPGRRRARSNSPAYRGIGPIRGDRQESGEYRWVQERVHQDSPPLAGEAFFEMAVDPTNGDIVWAATTVGLYKRSIAADGQPEWNVRVSGYFTSVIAVPTSAGTVFYAAGRNVPVNPQEGQPAKPHVAILMIQGDAVSSVFMSMQKDPDTMTTADWAVAITRLSLGVSASEPNKIFALLARGDSRLHSVQQILLRPVAGQTEQFEWIARPIGGIPSELLGGQANYNLSIAVDPADSKFLYIGGAGHPEHPHGAMIWCCQVEADQAGSPMSVNLSIGRHAHADVHALVHTPDRPTELWAGTDGGVFLNRNPRSMEAFEPRNEGLACLCPTFIDLHPTERGTLICGLQDNGTAYTANNPRWSRINWGDGGYCSFNWADPRQVALFMNGAIYRSDSGGSTLESFQPAGFIGWAEQGNSWVPPIVTTPYKPQAPNDANILAAATTHVTASGTRASAVAVSRDFGKTWPARNRNFGFVATNEAVLLPTSEPIFALAFASASRMVIATRKAEVFMADYQPTERKWGAPVRIDNVQAAPLRIRGAITDIAVDWSDAQRRSFYITFAGTGANDHRRVWHFDGERWSARSGSAFGAADALIDVEHNAIVVDPRAPHNVYVGADIGVWHSANRGQTWQPLPNGLPDAAVYDLKIHPTLPLLRAALYGRGIYEWELDPVAVA